MRKRHFAKRIWLFGILILIGSLSASAQTIPSGKFHSHRNPLKNSFLQFQTKKTGRVVFLGGSITFNGGWRDSLCAFLQESFPETRFEFINAGIPSMGSVSGAFRFERDVLKNGRVDLLFEEAAVNDEAIGHQATEIGLAMEGIVRHALQSNPYCDVVMMHFVDPGKIADYRQGVVPEVIQIHEQIAQHYQVPSINLAKEVTERMDAGEFDWENDFRNLHPSPFGQGVYFRSMKKFLQDEWSQTFNNGRKTKRKIPKPIHSECFDNGKLVEPGSASATTGWEWLENWNPQDGKGTRANYINVPMLVGKTPGPALRFEFKGNAVGLAVAAGPDAGIIEFRIDGAEWQKQDLFTPWSKGLYLPRYYTLATGLSNKKHLLQIRLSEEKNPESAGTSCVLRYFFINE